MPFKLRDLLNPRGGHSGPPAIVANDLEQAMALHRAGRLAEAEAAYAAIVTAQAQNAEALNLWGVAASQRGDGALALPRIERALSLQPDNATFTFNRGLVLHQLGRRDEAVAAFTRAAELRPDYAQAHANRGVVLQELGRLDEALAALDTALALKPLHTEALYNRANTLRQQGQLDDALAAYEAAIAARPDFGPAHYNRAFALGQLGRTDEAARGYEAAARLGCEFAAGAWLHAKAELCDWNGWDRQLPELAQRIREGERVCAPFACLVLLDDPALQRRAAEVYVAARHPSSDALGPLVRESRSGRIRVGYFSGDFREHAVAHLTASIFEAHDRTQVELVGFSHGSADGDPMRARIAKAFDRFIDVAALSDGEIARMARGMGIDIAVDLGGHTKHARIGIFARRAAPLQVSYVGYLGTTGAEYFDYLLADPVTVPPEARSHYHEKVAYLPAYHVGDAIRPGVPPAIPRAELGLPEGGFVYGCFSNAYKISPPAFDRWMRILRAVEGSVLMLHARNDAAVANLRSGAEARGVVPQRLVFVPSVPQPEYLARFRAADLFLDTLPYNAGTVALDALWAGLPVLTLAGQSIAGRVAASALHAAGLPELVAATGAEYEACAIELARNPRALAAVQGKLRRDPASLRLFDSAGFTRSLERIYRLMHERRRENLPPAHLELPTE